MPVDPPVAVPCVSLGGCGMSAAGRSLIPETEVEMSEVTELRIALTVDNFDEALAFYRDALGLTQLEDWSTEQGRVILLEAGRATLELFDEAQAEMVDQVEVGRRVSGPVRFALEVNDSAEMAAKLVGAGADEVAQPAMTPWGDLNARVRAPDGMQLTLFTSKT